MWILVTADEIEQIVIIGKNLNDINHFRNSKDIFYLSYIYKNSKKINIKGIGKCYIKKINFVLEDDDLKFAQNNIDYLFDNFNYKQICKKLNISVRTYMRHINEKKYFLKKIRRLLNEADNRKED